MEASRPRRAPRLQLTRDMAESTPASVQPLSQRMETLAALEPSPFPVISLYLSLSTNQNGREDHQQFVRKVFNERAKALPDQSPERESFDKDVKRIQEYLEKQGRHRPARPWRSSRAVAPICSRPFRLTRRSANTRCSSARSRTCIRWPGSSRTIRAMRR